MARKQSESGTTEDFLKLSSQEKTQIVLMGLGSPEQIPSLCDRYRISRLQYDDLADTFIQCGARGLDELGATQGMLGQHSDVTTQEFLSDAIEALSEGVALFDDDDRLVLLNRKQREHLDPENAVLRIGGDLFEMTRDLTAAGSMIAPEGMSAEQYAELLTEAVRSCAQDVNLVASGGRYLLGSARKTPLGGRLIAIEDVTDRHNTEERARSMFVDALESLREGVALWDDDERLVFFNQKYLKFVDPEAEYHHIGQPMTEIFATMAEQGALQKPERIPAQEFTHSLLNLVRNSAQDVEVQFAHGVLKCSASVTPLGGRLVTLEDITETRKAELAQREADLLLHKIVDAFPANFLVSRLRDGHVIYRSPTSQKMFGNIESLNDLVRNTKVRDSFLAGLLSNGAVDDFHTRARTADGSVRDLMTSARMTDHKGEDVIVSSTRDITDQLSIEAELERQHEIAHQNEKLSAMGGLLAGVAHELNNPLSIVVGYALMLQETISDTKQKRQIERIGQAAERCARIIKAFLAMARKRPTHIQACSLNDIVTAALDVSGFGLKSSGAEVVLELDQDLPLTGLDPDQMIQVLINLISNAEHALEPLGAEGVLRICTYHHADTGQVGLDVRDNGAGIAPDVLARIFEPFFTTKDIGMGTGIGLAFCNRIISAHDGGLTVQSGLGEGACFSILLPIRECPPSDAPGVEHPMVNVGKFRVLVVDDEEGVTSLIRDILEHQGYHVHVCNSAPAALDILSGTTFDAILSDIKMPGLDGEGFLKEIQNINPLLVDQMAFVTGDAMSPQVAAFLDTTSVEHVEKPLTPTDLTELVHRLCQAKGRASND